MSILIGSCNCVRCVDEDLYPDADITVNAWEDSTGGDNDGAMWDEIDEVGSPDDATTYIRETADTLRSGIIYETDILIVGLQETASPGMTTFDYSSPATITFRARENTSGVRTVQTQLEYVLRNGSGTTIDSGSLPLLIGTSFQTLTDSVDMASSDINMDNMEVQLQCTAKQNGIWDVSWVELALVCK